MKGSHAGEEASVGWVWTAVAVWVLLAVPVAVVLGRVIRRADREEFEVPADVPLPGPRHRRRSPGHLRVAAP